MEEALLGVLGVMVRVYEDMGVGDVMLECLRVGEGRLWYCYDTWMRGSLEIVRGNKMDIEGYFLSDR